MRLAIRVAQCLRRLLFNEKTGFLSTAKPEPKEVLSQYKYKTHFSRGD
jgi:hypothetical protein